MVGGFVTNIVLDAWFVAGLQLGVSGAALATIIGSKLVFSRINKED
jgi:Na+-driven multidrug efflux pump